MTLIKYREYPITIANISRLEISSLRIARKLQRDIRVPVKSIVHLLNGKCSFSVARFTSFLNPANGIPSESYAAIGRALDGSRIRLECRRILHWEGATLSVPILDRLTPALRCVPPLSPEPNRKFLNNDGDRVQKVSLFPFKMMTSDVKTVLLGDSGVGKT
jgi:hypothetical protein